MNRRTFIKHGALTAAGIAAGVSMPTAIVIETCTRGPIPVVFGQRRMNGSIVYTDKSVSVDPEEMWSILNEIWDDRYINGTPKYDSDNSFSLEGILA